MGGYWGLALKSLNSWTQGCPGGGQEEASREISPERRKLAAACTQVLPQATWVT